MRLSLLPLLAIPGLALAQGPLTPPGAPGATMRSLDQIEPRIPLVAGSPGVAIGGTGTITISQPGSYFLTQNLTVSSGHGIVVGSNDVTLDLRGFTINSSATGGFGINVSNVSRVAISNGSVRGSFTYSGTFTGTGFGSGIDYSGTSPTVVRVKDVSVEGVQSYGIDLGTTNANLVESCVVRIAGQTGIRAGVVSDSAAMVIGVTPVAAETITNCIGRKADGSVQISATQPTIADLKTDTTALLAAGEKRTAISTAPIILSTSGSYYLTGNLTVSSGDAITITGEGVSIDLNGFTIRSTSATASGSGIAINANRATVFNGQIAGGVTYNGAAPGDKFTGPGFQNGIFAAVNINNVLVHHVTVNGCDLDGIRLQSTESTVVHDCLVHVAGGYGISGGSINNCSAFHIAKTAIYGKNVSNSYGATHGTGFVSEHGIQAESVINSSGSAVDGNGINADSVTNSRGHSLAGAGIFADTATGCRATSTSNTGITAVTLSNCYGSSNGSTGIFVHGTASFCRARTASGGFAMNGVHAFGCTVEGGTNNCTYKDSCH